MAIFGGKLAPPASPVDNTTEHWKAPVKARVKRAFLPGVSFSPAASCCIAAVIKPRRALITSSTGIRALVLRVNRPLRADERGPQCLELRGFSPPAARGPWSPAAPVSAPGPAHKPRTAYPAAISCTTSSISRGLGENGKSWLSRSTVNRPSGCRWFIVGECIRLARQCRGFLPCDLRGIDRRVFLEELDGLRLSILRQLEVILRQPRHRMPLLIHHRDIQQDQVRVLGKGVDAVFALGPRRLLCTQHCATYEGSEQKTYTA